MSRHGTGLRLAVLSLLALVSTAQDAIPCPPGCDTCSVSEYKSYSCSGMELNIYDNSRSAEINCQGQLLDCTKLPQLALGGGKPIKKLHIKSCALNSSLECVMSALNATGSSTLFFSYMKTTVSEETVRGLGMIDTLFVYYSDVQTSVPVEAIKLLPNLRMLRLSNDGLSAIAPHTFRSGDLKNSLGFLEISINNITTLPADAFNGLNNLINLTLFKNNLQEIDANAFRGLDSLRLLDLSNNNIVDLPAGVFHHTPQLKILAMTRNKRRLHLKAGVISGISLLNELVLRSDDKLELDSRSLSDLPALQTLDLKDSAISELPADLFHNSTAIVSLLLENNNLSSLPETVFEGLEKLQTLVLSSNKLQKVTGKMFQSLVGLREIYLDENLIEVLPEYLFSTMSRLKSVSIANNRIRTVNGYCFQGAASVTTLDLSRNELALSCPVYAGNERLTPTETQSPLNWLNNVEKLNLSHNNISRVCNDWTVVMTKLRDLNLSYNNFTEIWNTDVQFMSHNITVDLRHNHIFVLEPNNYIHHPTLLLEHNPFHCDCQLYEFLRQLQSGRSPYRVGDATCRDATMNGSSLYSSEGGTSVSLDDLTCLLNDTTQGCTCVSRPAKNRMECNCKTLNSTSLPNPAHYNGGISKMMLTLGSIQKEGLEGLPSFVNQLNLSHLELETIPDIPDTVTHVDLSHNKLSRVPLEILNRGNLTLELRNNPLKCGCLSTQDVKNIQHNISKVTKHNESLTCADGTLIWKVDAARLCDLCFGILFATFGLLAIAVSLAYRYSLVIRVWLYYHGCEWLVEEESLDAKKKYHIFLSFVHEDLQFIKETLLPKLDKEYKVCVHYRDWIVGDTIVDQIYRSVAESRRTLIVLSKDYLKSGWAVQEFNAVYKQAEVDKRPRAVVILLDDLKYDEAPEQIKTYLGLTTYIEWGDTLFWERLRYALPRKMKAKDLKLRNVTKLAVKNLANGGLNVVYNEEGKLVNAVDLKI